MLLLFILFDVPVQLILLSPVILWLTAAGRWRPLIIALAICLWGCLGLVAWRRHRRAEAEHKAAALPEGNWRWPAELPAESYDQRVRLLLHNHGWRGMRTLSVEAQAISLIMQKDRTHVVLCCRRDGRAPTPQEFTGLAALRDAHRASVACLMLAAPCPAPLVAAGSELGIHVLRLADIPFLESPTGPLAIDFA